MRVYKSLKPGLKGTKELVEQFGDTLVRVRYRIDEVALQVHKTVELIVETRKCKSLPKSMKVNISNDTSSQEDPDDPEDLLETIIPQHPTASRIPLVLELLPMPTSENPQPSVLPQQTIPETSQLSVPLQNAVPINPQLSVPLQNAVSINPQPSVIPQPTISVISQPLRNREVPVKQAASVPALESEDMFWFMFRGYMPDLFRVVVRAGAQKSHLPRVWGLPRRVAHKLGLLDSDLVKEISIH